MAPVAGMSETQEDKPGHVNLETPIPSPSKENTCPSREVMVTSQKGSVQRWAVSSCGLHRRSGKLEEKRRARPSPSRERGRDKPGSTRRRDSSHTKLRGKDRRPQPRSPGRTLKRSRSGEDQGAPYNSAKRRRQTSPPEASSSLTFSLLMSRVFTDMGGLQVALDDLQAPGGAFLHVPSSCTEPTVSQRAWLTWQLAHAGAALHWALYTVNSILNAQASLPRYNWPQGDSFTADPSPVPTSSAFARPGAETRQRHFSQAFRGCKKHPGLSTAGQRDQEAGLESSEHQTHQATLEELNLRACCLSSQRHRA